MRLPRDRAERHRAGGEPAHDGLRRLDFLDRNRLAATLLGALDAEQAADGQEALRLLVDDLREGPIALEGIAPHRVLERGNRRRRPDVVLAAHAKLVFASNVEGVA